MGGRVKSDPLAPFHPAVRDWFLSSFSEPTRPQSLGWPAIARGESTLILAPTGSGKTLTAFLWALDRLMFTAPPDDKRRRCRVVYISPLKALAVDVERNLRAAPLVGRGVQLSLQLGVGQAQRLEGAHLFRISLVFRACLLAFALELFHPLLNARIRID